MKNKCVLCALAVFVVVGLCGGSSADIVTNGLVLYLDAANYVPDSQVWMDQSGLANDGILGDSNEVDIWDPSLIKDVYRSGPDSDPNYKEVKAMCFTFGDKNPGNGSIVRIPMADSLDLGSFADNSANFTVEMWAKNTCHYRYQWLLDYRTYIEDPCNPNIISRVSGFILRGFEPGEVAAEVTDVNGNTSRTRSLATDWPDPVWKHITVTVDSTTDVLDIYMNSMWSVNVTSYQGGDLSMMKDALTPDREGEFIGMGRGIVPKATTILPSLARIAVLRVYNRVLSEAEIIQNYEAGFNLPVTYGCSELIKGDLDSDCDADFSDFAIMADNWLKDNFIN
ncbi:MAG: LamG-like jellyroll fold domain-containing protein [Planctomycetota bacterium]